MRRALRTLLTGTTLVAMSNTHGRSSRVGAAMAMGFVPRRGARPKVGATSGPVAVMQTPIMSWGSASMAW